MEFKVGEKLQFGNNLVFFPMDRFHRTFLSGEKVIGWNVCQTHSKLVAASLAKSVLATNQANCC